MSLIDATYFTADINIPQGAYNTIQEYIDRYEPLCLMQILGNDLYKLVKDYNPSTSPQRIKDLVEGKEYSWGNWTVKWNGLINGEKISLIAYYVYIQYVSDKQVNFQNVGANVDPNATTATGIIQKAGGRLRALAGHSYQSGWEPSLWNFLIYHIDVYPEWFCPEYQPPNAFDI